MYVTVAEFRGSGTMPMIAQATAPAIPNDEVETLSERASELFDLVCGVETGHFNPASLTATARTFYGNGTNFLKLDPYVSGSLNATLSYPSGYTALDYVERWDIERPYLVITDSTGVLSSRSSFYNGWYCGVPITVTARWGFAATPAPVKQAVIKLMAEMWRITDPANQKILAIEGQPISPQNIPPYVAAIAKRYRSSSGVLV